MITQGTIKNEDKKPESAACIISGKTLQDICSSAKRIFDGAAAEKSNVADGRTDKAVWLDIMQTEQESEKEYEQVIPVSALREELGGAYCLIVVEKEEMLGTLKVAKKVPVTVLEKDGKNAAITSELKKEDKVIVSSEKFVSGGDRVRIKE